MEREVICLDTSIPIDYFKKKDKETTVIAAIAINNKLKLASLNRKHFEKVAQLNLLSDFE